MPNRHDPNIFEVLIGQVSEDVEINIVLSKALRILPETELFEPVRNLVHRRPSTDLTPSVLDRHVGGVYQHSLKPSRAALTRPTVTRWTSRFGIGPNPQRQT